MQAQPQIVTRGQDHVHVQRKVRQQPGELGERLPRGQLVQIVDHQREPPSRASASSDSTRSTIAGALKSGVAADGPARPVVTKA